MNMPKLEEKANEILKIIKISEISERKTWNGQNKEHKIRW